MSIIVTPEERITLRGKLREHFGFRRFRAGQEQAVAAAMQGKDTVVVMPTGSAMSPCTGSGGRPPGCCSKILWNISVGADVRRDKARARPITSIGGSRPHRRRDRVVR